MEDFLRSFSFGNSGTKRSLAAQIKSMDSSNIKAISLTLLEQYISFRKIKE
jgi:hypothetical protein